MYRDEIHECEYKKLILYVEKNDYVFKLGQKSDCEVKPTQEMP